MKGQKMKKCFLVSGLVLAASGVLGMRDDPMNADVNLNLKNKVGNTAQDWAEMKGYIDILSSGEGVLSRPDLRKIVQEDVERLAKIRWGNMSTEDKGLNLDDRFKFWDFIEMKDTRLKEYTKIIYEVVELSDEEKQKMLDGLEKLVNRHNESSDKLKGSGTYVENLVREWFNSVNSSKQRQAHYKVEH
ncbi:MAG: hypothetical protein K5766_05020 [Alphaproteobacteria bacterium]|nr:hypothetical protein [Alphaproteobacteria bacterium]